MKKYFLAGLAGLALIAGQAAASENAIVGYYGDRIGGPADPRVDHRYHDRPLLAVLFGAGVITLIAWELSEHGHHGRSASV